ncbi:MAG: hypothetical protein EA383_04835 [Spirochaetaceae bacterium]|nr:MAG: hypothetical protein EA383_04835 [Spirochaetaceae bacterium]
MTADIIASVRVTPQISQPAAFPAVNGILHDGGFADLLSREVSSVRQDRPEASGYASEYSTAKRESETERDKPVESSARDVEEIEDEDDSSLKRSKEQEGRRNDAASVKRPDGNLDKIQEKASVQDESDAARLAGAAVEKSVEAPRTEETKRSAKAEAEDEHEREYDHDELVVFRNAAEKEAFASEQTDRKRTAAAEAAAQRDTASAIDGASVTGKTAANVRARSETDVKTTSRTDRPVAASTGEQSRRAGERTATEKTEEPPKTDGREGDVAHRRTAEDRHDQAARARSQSQAAEKDSERNSLTIDVRDHRRGRNERSQRNGESRSRVETAAGDGAESSRSRPVIQSQAGGETGNNGNPQNYGAEQAMHSRAAMAASQGDTRSDAALRLAQTLRDQGASEIVRQAQVILRDNNEGELRLLLKPESLGTVRIRMEMIEDRVALRIFVDNETAGDVFRDSIADLQRSFEESGVSTGAFEVSVHDGSQEGAGQNGASGERYAESPQNASRDQYSEVEHITADFLTDSGSEHRVNVMA